MCKDIVVYDMEIAKSVDEVGGWGNVIAGKAGVSFAASYSYRDNAYKIFGEDNIGDLRKQLETAGLVVGFNHMQFDNKLLTNLTGGDDLKVSENYDILRQAQKVLGRVKGYKLTELAARTLGPKYAKKMSGALAPTLYAEKKYGELITYNVRDVQLTKMLFDFILQYQYIITVENAKVVVGLPDFQIIMAH